MYALLHYGNLEWQYHYLTKKADYHFLKHAYKFYHAILHDHIRNVSAAHGLGIICAIQGDTTAAKEIFAKVSRSNTSMY